MSSSLRAAAVVRSAAGTLVAGAAVGLVLGVGIVKTGALLPLGLLVLAGCWALLWRPAVTLGLLVGTAVAFEDTPGAVLTVSRWYEGLPVVLLGPTDLLLFVLIAGVVLEITREHDAHRLTGPFTTPIVLLAVATLAGLVTGRAAGATTTAIFPQIRPLLFFIVLVPVAGYLLSKRDRWRTALTAAAVLIPVKAATGLLTRFHGGEMAPGQDPVTFYEPTMNFLMVLFLLTVTGAAIRRVHLPRWIWLSTPVVTLSLLLSFRRSFWVAAILGLFLVALVATGRRSRPFVALGAVAIVLALWVAIAAGGSTDSTNPIIDRAESLSPTRLESTSSDRYRLGEQRNVIAELRAHPLTGLGLGIPWAMRYPMSERPIGGLYYTHVTPLWFWLKLGPLGLLSYLWLWLTAIPLAHRLWRRGPDPLVRVTALAVATGSVGLMVAELTGPFTGIDFRLTIVVAAMFGWLTATATTLRADSPARAPGYAVARR